MNKFFILFALIFTVAACSSSSEVKNEEVSIKESAAPKKAESKESSSEEESESASTAADGESVEKITCTVDEDTRTVEVISTGETSCEVNYSKHGGTESIAQAQNDKSYCSNVAAKVKGNLEAAGFTCN